MPFLKIICSYNKYDFKEKYLSITKKLKLSRSMFNYFHECWCWIVFFFFETNTLCKGISAHYLYLAKSNWSIEERDEYAVTNRNSAYERVIDIFPLSTIDISCLFSPKKKKILFKCAQCRSEYWEMRVVLLQWALRPTFEAWHWTTLESQENGMVLQLRIFNLQITLDGTPCRKFTDHTWWNTLS